MDDESINKKCKQKVFASNINTREISIYKYTSRKLFKSPKIGRAPKKKKMAGGKAGSKRKKTNLQEH